MCIFSATFATVLFVTQLSSKYLCLLSSSPSLFHFFANFRISFLVSAPCQNKSPPFEQIPSRHPYFGVCILPFLLWWPGHALTKAEDWFQDTQTYAVECVSYCGGFPNKAEVWHLITCRLQLVSAFAFIWFNLVSFAEQIWIRAFVYITLIRP